MKIAIATDTNSGITAMEGEKLGVFVLAMPVNLEETIHYEGIDITSEQLYDAMRQHRDVSTSQPSPGQLMELWDGILAKGYDEIVYIPMSSGLSGSCQSAALFAQDYDGRVQVVDNHRISVTQKESVIWSSGGMTRDRSGTSWKSTPMMPASTSPWIPWST